MVQRGEGLRFALEACEPLGVVRERLGQDFDRDVSVQLGIAGSIHLAHPAFADLGRDLVDAKAGAGGEGQIAVDYTGGTVLDVLARATGDPLRQIVTLDELHHERTNDRLP